jgi:hypothetical protein
VPESADIDEDSVRPALLDMAGEQHQVGFEIVIRHFSQSILIDARFSSPQDLEKPAVVNLFAVHSSSSLFNPWGHNLASALVPALRAQPLFQRLETAFRSGGRNW